jgi:AcrR family transcriptional regulator
VGFMIPAAILHPMADRRTHRWDFWAAGARQAAQAAYPFLDRAINRSGDDNGPIEGLKTDFGGLVQALRTSSSGKLFRQALQKAVRDGAERVRPRLTPTQRDAYEDVQRALLVFSAREYLMPWNETARRNSLILDSLCLGQTKAVWRDDPVGHSAPIWPSRWAIEPGTLRSSSHGCPRLRTTSTRSALVVCTRMASGPAERARLLRLVRDHILAHGVVELSLSELARAIGSNNRMLLYHFRSLDNLLTEAINTVLDGDALISHLSDLLGSGTDIADGIATAWRHISDPTLLTHLRLFYARFGMAAESPQRYADFLERTRIEWVTTVAGALKHDSRVADSTDTALAIVALWRGLQMLLIAGESRAVIDRVHDETVRAMLGT